MQTINNKQKRKIKHLISLIKYYFYPTRTQESTQESTQEKINNFIKFLEKKYITNN